MAISKQGFLDLKNGAMREDAPGKGPQRIEQSLRLAEAVCLQNCAAALVELGGHPAADLIIYDRLRTPLIDR